LGDESITVLPNFGNYLPSDTASKETWIFSNTAVRTLNLTKRYLYNISNKMKWNEIK
jgi:hypothetical protein